MSEKAQVRLLFVADGSYHHEDVSIPVGVLENYERIIDCLREDPGVLRELYVDLDRLCLARVIRGEA